MAGLAYNHCITTGHDAYPPTDVNATQSKVFTGGIAVVRDGDPITPHTKTTKPHDTHGGVVEARTSKVFVNGKKAAQIADPISCGDTIAQSSHKVFIH